MPSKMTVSVHDDIHNQNAVGIKYDLWRVNNQTNRVIIKQDIIINDSMHLLIQADKAEDLGTFEIIFYVKDYFERLNAKLDVRDSRFTLPFGISQLERDYHLNVHITPTGFACSL